MLERERYVGREIRKELDLLIIEVVLGRGIHRHHTYNRLSRHQREEGNRIDPELGHDVLEWHTCVMERVVRYDRFPGFQHRFQHASLCCSFLGDTGRDLLQVQNARLETVPGNRLDDLPLLARQADPDDIEPACLVRDPTAFAEKLLAVADANDRLIDSAERRLDPAQALDLSLLRPALGDVPRDRDDHNAALGRHRAADIAPVQPSVPSARR